MNDDPTRRDDGEPISPDTHSPSTRRRPALGTPPQPTATDAERDEDARDGRFADDGRARDTLPYGRLGADETERADPDFNADLVKPSFGVAPITIGLIVFMGALELLFTLTDGASGPLRQVRAQVFDLFAFSPLETYAWWYGQLGVDALYGVFGHMLLHGGLLHFALNAAAMAFLGPTVERDAGSAGYVFVFVLAGVGGALGHGLWQYGVGMLNPEIGVWSLRVELVGASGAISGILGAEIYRRANALRALPPERRKSAPLAYLLNASVGFLLVNVLISLMGSFISGASHIGGFVAGMAAAAAIGLRPTLPRRRPH